jgi:hypothetical protein
MAHTEAGSICAEQAVILTFACKEVAEHTFRIGPIKNSIRSSRHSQSHMIAFAVYAPADRTAPVKTLKPIWTG